MVPLRITTVRSEGLAVLSYFISSEGEALIIDPRRDVDIYFDIAKQEKTEIRHVFETHRNEDYVIGSCDVKHRAPSSQIGHSDATRFKYGDLQIADGDVFTVGKIRVTCLNTPGHTDDSMCYILADESVGSDPVAAFTGDTLFVGEVGRTDLVDIKKHEQMSRKLYHSLHDKVLPLKDGVMVYPGHGAGSVCGGAIGERDLTTIGYERAYNPWLNIDEDKFVERKLDQHLTRAPYFKRCEHLNTIGPPIVAELPSPIEMNVDDFEQAMQDDKNVILDTRSASEFVKGHIPHSISLPLRHMGLFAGWVLEDDKNFFFALGVKADLDNARGMLLRVGLDSVVGYLKEGISSWFEAGKSIKSFRTYSIQELRTQVDGNLLKILDVRQPHETEKEIIEGSLLAPLTSIAEDIEKVDPKTPIATMCPAGFRATTGASILAKAGFENVGVPLAGLKGWQEAGYPIQMRRV